MQTVETERCAAEVEAGEEVAAYLVRPPRSVKIVGLRMTESPKFVHNTLIGSTEVCAETARRPSGKTNVAIARYIHRQLRS